MRPGESGPGKERRQHKTVSNETNAQGEDGPHLSHPSNTSPAAPCTAIARAKRRAIKVLIAAIMRCGLPPLGESRDVVWGPSGAGTVRSPSSGRRPKARHDRKPPVRLKPISGTARIG